MPAIIQETPAALVEGGYIHSGFFREPFRRVNMEEAKSILPLLPKPLKRLRLKEWVGFGISHPDLFGGIIIQNTGYAASGTVYLYDRSTGKQYEWLHVDLPNRVRLPETLYNSESYCGFGKRLMRFNHNIQGGAHTMEISFPASKHAPALTVALALYQDMTRVEPLVVSLPIPPAHHTYTHKSPLKPEGTIRIGSKSYSFDPARDIANLDEQKTYYPYRSFWKWGCFGCRTAEGRELMLNIVDQMTPAGEPGEDCIWLDGKLQLLDPPHIDPDGRPGDYRITGSDGRLDLRFASEGGKKEKRNFAAIMMDYEQYYGRYDGEIVDADGNSHHIESAFGALERMNARF